MITDFFINILSRLLNLLPSIPSSVTFAFSDMYYVLNKANYYFPVQEFFTCLGLYFLIVNWKVLFSIIRWLAERIVI